MKLRSYLWEWIRETFVRPYGIAQGALGFLGFIGYVAFNQWPDLEKTLTSWTWKIPWVIFLVGLPITFIYWSFRKYRSIADLQEPRLIIEDDIDHQLIMNADQEMCQLFCLTARNGGFDSIKNVSVEIESMDPEPAGAKWFPGVLQLRNDNEPDHKKSQAFSLRWNEPQHLGFVQKSFESQTMYIYLIAPGVSCEVYAADRYDFTITARGDGVPPATKKFCMEKNPKNKFLAFYVIDEKTGEPVRPPGPPQFGADFSKFNWPDEGEPDGD